MSNPRTTQRDIDRQLQDAWIVMKDSHAVADPLVFLRAELGATPLDNRSPMGDPRGRLNVRIRFQILLNPQ